MISNYIIRVSDAEVKRLTEFRPVGLDGMACVNYVCATEEEAARLNAAIAGTAKAFNNEPDRDS